jgi:hypothetical protein
VEASTPWRSSRGQRFSACCAEQLDLTGTKSRLHHGQCGACNVLLDGVRVKSCLFGRQRRRVGRTGWRPPPREAAFSEEEKTDCSQYLGGMVCGIGHALLEVCEVDPRTGAYMNDNISE